MTTKIHGWGPGPSWNSEKESKKIYSQSDLESLVAQARREEKAKTALEASEIIHEHFMVATNTLTMNALESCQQEILAMGISPNPSKEK